MARAMVAARISGQPATPPKTSSVYKDKTNVTRSGRVVKPTTVLPPLIKQGAHMAATTAKTPKRKRQAREDSPDPWDELTVDDLKQEWNIMRVIDHKAVVRGKVRRKRRYEFLVKWEDAGDIKWSDDKYDSWIPYSNFAVGNGAALTDYLQDNQDLAEKLGYDLPDPLTMTEHRLRGR